MSASENRSAKVPESRADLAHLLEERRQLKQRTPRFRRFESWRFDRIDEAWRKPKGVDNHMRLSVKGWPALVKIGYRSPKSVRYLHPSGYKDVLVHNPREVEVLNPRLEAARIASGVGKKKRIEIAKRAKELGIRVLNGRNLLIGVKAEKSGKSSESKESSKTSKGKKE